MLSRRFSAIALALLFQGLVAIDPGHAASCREVFQLSRSSLHARRSTGLRIDAVYARTGVRDLARRWLDLPPVYTVAAPKEVLERLSRIAEMPEGRLEVPVETELLGQFEAGHELRLYLYFPEIDTQQIKTRITIRRNGDDTWSVGTSLYERQLTAEMDLTFLSYDKESEMLRERRSRQNAAAIVHSYLRAFRAMMVEARVRAELGSTVREWQMAIGNRPSTDWDLIALSAGRWFNLASGLHVPRLKVGEAWYPERAKFMRAVQYLIDNRLTYWTADRSDGSTESEILFQGETRPLTTSAQHPSVFAANLYRKLEESGVAYIDGQWRQARGFGF